MQISKWGNSLAIRLPKAIADTLELKEGDEVDLVAKDNRTLEVRRTMTREEALEAMRSLRRPLPPGYKFDRNEANER
jgi:antitoxin MazE